MKNIRVINLAAYSSPEIIEEKRKEWVSYGADNNYYQYLIDLYHTSPTNNAAIQGISDLIYGQGVDAERADRDLEAYVNFKKIFQDEDIRRVCHDLKLYGHAAFQISFEGGKVIAAYHIARESIRPAKMNDDGDIDTFYFADDWSKCRESNFEAEAIPAFGFQSQADQTAILSVESYSPGSHYFTPCDYQGGVQYAELEGEVANYHLNNIKNGLSPSMIVNFNNGIPTEEEQFEIERDVLAKWSGSSNSGRAIIAFNDGKETAATIDPIQLSDAHNQYQFLSSECMQKIMVAHRITSPMLFGIKDQSGLGNNADEIQSASKLFTHTVVVPFQRLIEEAIGKVLKHNDLSLDVKFVQSSPFGEAVVEDDREKMSVHMSADVGNMSDSEAQQWLDSLEEKGEMTDLSEWELVSEEAVHDFDVSDEKAVRLFKRFAEPNARSKDDGGVYRVRYRYSPPRETTRKGNNVSRLFCKNMIANAKLGVEYRREDIDKMTDAGINSEFAKSGESRYDIWRFKGGKFCHHFWMRRVYRRKRTSNKSFLPLQPDEKGTQNRNLDNYVGVSPAQARESGFPEKNLTPPNYEDASTRPIDMK